MAKRKPPQLDVDIQDIGTKPKLEYSSADLGKEYKKEIKGKAATFPRGPKVLAGSAREHAARRYLGEPPMIPPVSREAKGQKVVQRATAARQARGLPEPKPQRSKTSKAARAYVRRSDLAARGFPNPARVAAQMPKGAVRKAITGAGKALGKGVATAIPFMAAETGLAMVGSGTGRLARAARVASTGMDMAGRAAPVVAAAGTGIGTAFAAKNIYDVTQEAKRATSAAKHGERHAQAAGKWGVKVTTPTGVRRALGMVTGQYEHKVEMPKVNYSLRRSPDKTESWKTSKGDTFILPSRMSIDEGYTKTFGQAFSEARKKQGAKGVFEWKGKKFTTKMRGER